MTFNKLYEIILESTSREDIEYFSAVEAEDFDKAQRMVIDKLKKLSDWGSGYDIWRILPQGESTFPMIIEYADNEVKLIQIYSKNEPSYARVFDVETGKELRESEYKQYSIITNAVGRKARKIINRIFNVDGGRDAGFQIVEYDSHGNVVPLSQRFK